MSAPYGPPYGGNEPPQPNPWPTAPPPGAPYQGAPHQDVPYQGVPFPGLPGQGPPQGSPPGQPTYGGGSTPDWNNVPPAGGGPGQFTGRGAGGGRKRRWRHRHTFLSLIVLVVLVALVQVLLTPWAFHIAGKFTPTGHWSGVAQGKTASGQRFAVQLNLISDDMGRHACSSQGGCEDFHGTAVICTAAGRYTFNNLSGEVGGWLSLNGQNMVLDLDQSKPGPTRNLQATLRGKWSNVGWDASDGGYLARDFLASGVPQTQLGSPKQSDAVALDFRPGNIDALCRGVTGH